MNARLACRLAPLLVLLVTGCPPVEPPADAAPLDAGQDASAPDAPADALSCSLACGSTRERCCRGADGEPACIDVSADVANCGLCGLDCVSTHRGDRCIAMQCSCGGFSIGCTGEASSMCCPSAPDGRAERCANLGRDFEDCGSCGRTCDPARSNRCEGGNCYCGTDGAVCAGTVTDLCCLDVFEVASCVDTTSDDLHCGGCNRRCRAFEHCVASTCVDFTARDAGPLDAASPRDAGPDAPAADAASASDAGVDAAG
ncbi:MAG: hypothetical protein K1X94_32085 [Sandaracinaceae bacterium]|nr:hypothetical protein [Sandaracinaceae bacterium]